MLKNSIKEFEELNVSEVMTNVFVGEMIITKGKSFSPNLLKEITEFFSFVFNKENINNQNRVFVLTGEKDSGIFNLGGDLSLFLELIENKDSLLLYKYGESCLRLINQSLNAKNYDMTTVAIINGVALGGGLESALACDIIIAEKDYKVSLPEIKYGFFPGMGAFELISKRIGPREAKKLILSEEDYTTDKLYELGLFDYLVEKGEGVDKLKEVINKERSAQLAYNSVRKIYDREVPVRYEDLVSTLKYWVDSILSISEEQKEEIRRMIKIQKRRLRI